MAGKKPKTIPYRRKKEMKTNYKKRLRLLLAGKPRLVVRLTNQKIIAQIIDFKSEGDVVLVGVDSTTLKKYDWNFSAKNIPAAYLTGYLAGKVALQKKVTEVILDVGFKSMVKGNKIYAFLKGAVEAGLKVNHSPEVFPGEERVAGKHIEDYAQKVKGEGPFSKYLKDKLDPSNMSDAFQKTKGALEKI